MFTFLLKAVAFFPDFAARFKVRRDSGPIDSVDGLCSFVSTRAAFVAQKTLYGYLKTRMGTRYPSMFSDDVFISSINIAKMHVYAACLSDLSVFAASRALREQVTDDSAYRDLALRCFRRGLDDNAESAREVGAFSAAEALTVFERRLAFQDWHSSLADPDLFSVSPQALFEWAPIAPQLKRDDKEIVQNSIRFTWRDIRVQLKKRIDGAAILADLSGSRDFRN